MKNMLALAAALICLSGAASAQSWDGYDRTVYVINNTSETLMAFYASSVEQRSWQEDLLGSSVIMPGNAVEAYIDDGTGYCLYDLKAVFADGVEVVRWRYNVCDRASWEIYD